MKSFERIKNTIEDHPIKIWVICVVLFVFLYFVFYPWVTGRFTVRKLNNAMWMDDKEEVKKIISETPVSVLNRDPSTGIGDLFDSIAGSSEGNPINEACFHGYYYGAKLLAEKGVELNDYETNALCVAMYGSKKDTIKICTMLLENGADPQAGYKYGRLFINRLFSEHIFEQGEYYTEQDIIQMLVALEKSYKEFGYETDYLWKDLAYSARDCQEWIKRGDISWDEIDPGLWKNIEEYCEKKAAE